jgi:hypothetical protein
MISMVPASSSAFFNGFQKVLRRDHSLRFREKYDIRNKNASNGLWSDNDFPSAAQFDFDPIVHFDFSPFSFNFNVLTLEAFQFTIKHVNITVQVPFSDKKTQHLIVLLFEFFLNFLHIFDLSS